MRSGADLRGASPLVSYVTDPHFVAFSSSLYTTICSPKYNPNPNPNLNSDPDPNPEPNSNPNPNLNPTVITDPQIGRRDPQIVTIHIRPADEPRSAFCHVPDIYEDDDDDLVYCACFRFVFTEAMKYSVVFCWYIKR